MKLKLYYFLSCPFCQFVLHEIDKLKIKVELIDIHQDNEAREYLFQITGRYTVPCLFIDDTPMHESRDIINWLNSNKDNLLTND